MPRQRADRALGHAARSRAERGRIKRAVAGRTGAPWLQVKSPALSISLSWRMILSDKSATFRDHTQHQFRDVATLKSRPASDITGSRCLALLSGRCCGGALATMLTARSKRSHASGSNSSGLLFAFVIFIAHLYANQGQLNAGFRGDLLHQRKYQTFTAREERSSVGLACASSRTESRLND
jgi:hypothetical protein